MRKRLICQFQREWTIYPTFPFSRTHPLQKPRPYIRFSLYLWTMLRILLFCTSTLILFACQPSAAREDQSPVMPVESIALAVDVPVLDSPLTDTTQVDTTPERERFSLDALLGKIAPAKDQDFERIGSAYTSKSNIYMRKDAYAAFKEMFEAAKEDGHRLNIVSATRNFNHQKSIWERKWTGATKVGGQNLSQTIADPSERATKILRYSSMPGTSRHHWGTDIDLNNLNNSYFESGAGKSLYVWLTEHATEYGFCQVYSEMGEDRPHGYQEEKWHWSYLPIAKLMLEDYRALVDYNLLGGFKGDEAAESLSVIDHYVAGINPACH